jgi:hypothetical protein
MPKIRLRQAVCFDGETFPTGHVFDTDFSPISAECLIQREWGEEVSEDPPEPKAVSQPAPADEPHDIESQDNAVIPSESPKKPRKK